MTTTESLFEKRPWGEFHVLCNEGHFKAKKIIVNAAAQLSYQSHKKREEHWIVVKGRGMVLIDDKAKEISVGHYIHVPKGSKHRVKNTGEGPLEFIEVQLGSYFGEDDITRYQDDYNRV